MTSPHFTSSNRPLLALFALSCVCIAGASAQSTLSYDLEAAGQWDANFRTLQPFGTGTSGQTSASGNGFFRQDVTSGTAAGIYLFDQTPADTSAGTQSTFATSGPITVSFTLRAVTTNSSFSVVFIDPANTANNLLAVFNLIAGGDTVRFFKDGTLLAGNVGTQAGTTITQTTSAEPNSGNFTSLSVTLSVSGTTPTITVTPAGATATTFAFPAGDFDFNAGKTLIALRINDAGGTASNTPVDIDNIVINSPTAPDNPPETNVAPALPTQANRSIAPFETLTVTNTATDSNTPAQILTYELLNPPAGATISAAGVISWTPNETQGGASYTIETRVTDSGSPALSATNSFQITVSEFVPQPNVAPVLPTQENRSVAVANLITPGTLTVTNTATDSNLPVQTLAYELLSPPAGAVIDSSGIITWSPTAEQAGSTYTLTTRVTDSGSPPLSATNSFQVTVTPAPPLGSQVENLDFSTPGQFEAKFRPVVLIGGGTAGQNAANQLVVNATSNGGNTTTVFLFDSSPSDASYATQSSFPQSEPVTVSFLVRATNNDSSMGVLFADPRNASNHVSALFNLKTGDDTVRFFRDGFLAARSAAAGTQVGNTATLATAAEPASGEYIRVTVSLAVSGTTPTLTVVVGDLPAVTSAFAAGDLDWVRSLVLLRATDSSSTSGSLVEFSSLLIGGAAPIAPPAAILPPAPGGDGNLLTVNPGFEAGSLNNFSGSYSFTGWTGSNALFSSHAILTGSVAAGTTTQGVKRLLQSWGGTLVTDAVARPPISPGQTVELNYDQRSLIRNFPSEKLGTLRFIEFFDSAGIRIKQVWGTKNDYKVQYLTKDIWEPITLRAVAPANAAYVGVRVEASAGRFVSNEENYTQDRHVEFDNFRLTVVPETSDKLAWRRAPRLVEPGRTAVLRLNHAAPAARTLRASLLDAEGAEQASAQIAVPAGRFRGTSVSVAIPSGLADGTYAWRLELLPPSGSGAALTTRIIPGVIIDQSVAAPTLNATDFRADHPRIRYMGRIEELPNGSRWLHWFGSEVFARFSGTSINLNGMVSDDTYGGYGPWSIRVVVNEDFDAPLTVAMPLNGNAFSLPLVTGLPDGIHTVRVFKGTETNLRLRIDSLRVNPGRGLLVPEPASPRKLETFGDSVTSGSSAAFQGLFGYGAVLGRELDAQNHMISKGGTGVAASFSGLALLGSYYDNLAFPNTFNGSNNSPGSPWDFSRYTPDLVVIGIGHNDQFNGGAGNNFNTKYAEFKGLVRSAYPDVKIVSANTLISASLGHYQNATEPLTSSDPKHLFAFQPNTWNDSNTAHPPTDGHIAQIMGDERRYSLADVVEDLAGWGLDAPVSAYEQWYLAEFTANQISQGLHLPVADADFDGASNFLEYALGGNPNNPASTPTLASSPGAPGTLNLTFFRARAGLDYIVERSTNLTTWSPLFTNPGSSGGLVQVNDTIITGEPRFYRLRATEP